MSKILIFDIETSPNVVYSWRIGNKISLSAENIIEERKIICICWKWADEKKIHSLTWDKNLDDKAMLSTFIEEINKSDVAIAHNGDHFDVKWLQTRAIYHKLPPVSGIVTTDTLKMSRQNFNFNSNRLDYIGQYLGLGKKMETGGFSLWKRVMAGNRLALRQMVDYCKQDVQLLDDVFKRLLPYTKNLSWSAASLTGTKKACDRCASSSSQKWGFYTAKSGRKYQKYKCNGCNRVYRDTKHTRGADV